MRRDTVNYALLGGFVTAMLAAVVVSAALLAGRVGPRDSYFILLENVADVGFGTQVRYEGYPIGQVDGIAPVADGAVLRFRVDIAVDRGWRIPADSVARIGSTSFLGAKTIDIDSGEAGEPVEIGGQVTSAAPKDVFAAMSEVAGEFTDLSQNSLAPMLKQVRTLVGHASDRVEHDLAALLGRLNNSAAAVEGMLSPENAASLGRLIENAEVASHNLKQGSGDLRESMARINGLIAELDRMIAENRGGVNNALKDLRYSLAAVARGVDTIVHNFEGTARNMNEFSRVIRRNPSLLISGGSSGEDDAVQESAYGRDGTAGADQ